ncbi:MAG: hypothetical protein IT580_17970 [Verrucomicrobiales bacterium]|nr:hypothetical protein [Verrucomicrobiales bacterium]
MGTVPVSAAPAAGSRRELARRILDDPELPDVLARARALLRTGLNAGDGYGEVWIRDLNTFIELALEATDRRPIREALLTFFKFQGDDGNIVDGYIPEAKATVGYKYRQSSLAPGLRAHKNTVETDQESSLIQAVARYVRVSGDVSLLDEVVAGRGVRERMARALEYLWTERFDAARGLIWGATTVDWGDVQPEHEWGVELDQHSHRAIDIYDNAMAVVSVEAFLGLGPVADSRVWRARVRSLKQAIRRHLWDAPRRKYVPHLYLEGSPFPPEFNEAEVWYHGGTTVAMEAGLLSRREVGAALESMRANVRQAGASSIGLTVYPPYPEGTFKNKGMAPWSYQNGGDWCWFGARTVRQLLRFGYEAEAYEELLPMVRRVREHGGFFEWWTRDNRPKGSGTFRGGAGVIGQAIVELLAWAERHR